MQRPLSITITVTFSLVSPLMLGRTQSVRHLKVHQLLQYSLGKGHQKSSPPEFPSASKNAVLLSAIVITPFRLSFVLSTF